LPSTPSSDNAPGDNSTRAPSRAAIALLAFVSLAIPAGLLALILTHDSTDTPARSATNVPTTTIAPTDTRKAAVGTPAPEFALPSTTGATVSVAGLRGRPVVIAFFASWCHPCEEELPVLEQFARDVGDRLRVIGVSFQDLASDSKAFVERLHVTFPALLDDPTGPVAKRYGVRGIPQTVFVDARGIVRGRVYGETSRKALQPAIDDLLRGVDIRPI
jgi:cytochrome c biogenesis protein CcmG, thiol:disulfide interchange protein DsbE